MSRALTSAHAPRARSKADPELVVGASTFGTIFEWYDFFLYGTLASSIARHFFSGVNETTGFILALASFGIGFLVRPLGALIFGRIGDMLGRKSTFLITLSGMGSATVLIGCIPDYSTIGIAAPLLLVMLRTLQGLAIGGEFAGAITYVFEHSPRNRRGLYTAFLTSSGMIGLLLSLLVIALVRLTMEEAEFLKWGWRVPFVISLPLLAICLWIRLKLHESPAFELLKAKGRISKMPLRETFLRPRNRRHVLIALATCAGQAVVFYSTTFYALFFLERAARLDTLTVTKLMSIALLFGAAAGVAVGWLSDRIGRKPLLILGFVLMTWVTFASFHGLLSAVNPALARAEAEAPLLVQAESSGCSFQFDPVGRKTFDQSACDIAVAALARVGVGYKLVPADGSANAQVRIGNRIVAIPNPAVLDATQRAAAIGQFRLQLEAELKQSGHLATPDAATIDSTRAILILMALLAVNALVCTPTCVILAELFPARIRYSALALPQNLGNGWFGGFLPATAFAIVAATGNIFAGLWYPVVIAGIALVIGHFCLPETRWRNRTSASAALRPKHTRRPRKKLRIRRAAATG